MKPLPTSPRIPADPAGKTRLHGSSSPLFPANPLDNEHGSCGACSAEGNELVCAYRSVHLRRTCLLVLRKYSSKGGLDLLRR